MSTNTTTFASSTTSSNEKTFESKREKIVEIPVEIVSEEEMAFIEAALASTRPALISSPARSILVSSLPSLFSPLRKHSGCIQISSSTSSTSCSSVTGDIEDSRRPVKPRTSLLQRFRTRRGLMVTDITATEWCEKQMEYALLCGKPKRTKAMKAGIARHIELEEEVSEKVEIKTKSVEESWALRFLNFIVRAKQLVFDGLTRELPVLGVVDGIWMIGVIDELRLETDASILSPLLVDTKTRYKATSPSDAQKRNSRLQLMCYKYLWDNLVTGSFPTDYFFEHFNLNPEYVLSEDLKQHVYRLGSDATKFKDVVANFKDSCYLFAPSQEHLLLRYELQSDCSLLEEYQFEYDADWFSFKIQQCLNFWMGSEKPNVSPRMRNGNVGSVHSPPCALWQKIGDSLNSYENFVSSVQQFFLVGDPDFIRLGNS